LLHGHFRPAVARSAGLVIATTFPRGLRPGLYAVTRFAGFGYTTSMLTACSQRDDYACSRCLHELRSRQEYYFRLNGSGYSGTLFITRLKPCVNKTKPTHPFLSLQLFHDCRRVRLNFPRRISESRFNATLFRGLIIGSEQRILVILDHVI
jgi:hypothetical protein